jgi:hypothetical protein
MIYPMLLLGQILRRRRGRRRTRRRTRKKDNEEEEEDLIFGWGNVPLSYEQVKHAALDARLGFKIARRHWKLYGYNSHVNRVNIKVDE